MTLSLNIITSLICVNCGESSYKILTKKSIRFLLEYSSTQTIW